jgi:hypothetical protein
LPSLDNLVIAEYAPSQSRRLLQSARMLARTGLTGT